MTASRFVRWWSDPKNKERVERIKERRKAVRSDPVYRERERTRKREALERKKGISKLPNPRIYHFNGQDHIIWPVGLVAVTLGVTKRTIANLERKGTIPTNRITDANDRRWWPASYVAWLKRFFDLKKSGDITSKEFSRRVWSNWQRAVDDGLFPVFSEVNTEHGGQEEQRVRGKHVLTDIFRDGGRASDRSPGQQDGED